MWLGNQKSITWFSLDPVFPFVSPVFRLISSSYLSSKMLLSPYFLGSSSDSVLSCPGLSFLDFHLFSSGISLRCGCFSLLPFQIQPSWFHLLKSPLFVTPNTSCIICEETKRKKYIHLELSPQFNSIPRILVGWVISSLKSNSPHAPFSPSHSTPTS